MKRGGNVQTPRPGKQTRTLLKGVCVHPFRSCWFKNCSTFFNVWCACMSWCARLSNMYCATRAALSYVTPIHATCGTKRRASSWAFFPGSCVNRCSTPGVGSFHNNPNARTAATSPCKTMSAMYSCNISKTWVPRSMFPASINFNP